MLIDACVCINMLATGQAKAIAESFSVPIAIVDRVLANEVLRAVDPKATLTPGRDRPLASDVDWLSTLTLEEAEASRYVEVLAHDLGDGESITGAIAIERGFIMGTDDKKAIRVLRSISNRLCFVQTPDLVHHWAKSSNVPQSILRRAIAAVASKARYSAPRDHPHYIWWQQHRDIAIAIS